MAEPYASIYDSRIVDNRFLCYWTLPIIEIMTQIIGRYWSLVGVITIFLKAFKSWHWKIYWSVVHLVILRNVNHIFEIKAASWTSYIDLGIIMSQFYHSYTS